MPTIAKPMSFSAKSRFASVALGVISALALPGAAIAGPAPSKDVGPASAVCDSHNKASVAWRTCVGAASAKMSDEELFYAGYWMAKTGKYQQALGYLTLTKDKSVRVLTYIGYATRKLGDVDAALPFYSKALKKNPGFAVARAYLGEAYLTKGQPGAAKAELAEIAVRCGTSCAAYLELAQAINSFEKTRG